MQSMEYKYNRQAFDQKARSMTQKYARAGASDFGGRDQEIQTLTNAREGHVSRCLDARGYVYYFFDQNLTHDPYRLKPKNHIYQNLRSLIIL